MGWRESLQQAKFKGVPFHVSSYEFAAGRKTIEHGYPKRDRNSVEDLGRATRRYAIEGYMVGNDYNLQRDALVQVCEVGGIGELNHPYLGDMQVELIAQLRVQENSRDGRMCVITLKFIEAAPPSTPAIIVNTQRGLLDRANDFIDAALADFLVVYDIFQAGQAALEAVGVTINNLKVALDTFISYGKRSLDFQTAWDSLVNSTLGLVQTGADLAGTITTLFTSDNTIEAIFENLRFQEFGSDDTTTDQNAQALNTYIRQMAVVGSCLAVSNIEFTDQAQASQARALIGAALDSLMEESNDIIYESLHAVYGAILKDIETRSIALPSIIEKTLSDDMPSLFLSYDFYEGIDQAADIVSRNRVHHPGFLPGGVPMELLSRAE